MPTTGGAGDTPINNRDQSLLLPRNGNRHAIPHNKSTTQRQSARIKSDPGRRMGYQTSTWRHVTPCNCRISESLSFSPASCHSYDDAMLKPSGEGCELVPGILQTPSGFSSRLRRVERQPHLSPTRQVDRRPAHAAGRPERYDNQSAGCRRAGENRQRQTADRPRRRRRLQGLRKRRPGQSTG